MAAKKTLYEILEVPPTATYPEIAAAHQQLVKALELEQPNLSREDYDIKLRLIKVAFSTLSTPLSRDAYDAHLTVTPVAPKPGTLTLVPPNTNPESASLRADALLLRAEALTLRAEAMGLKADLATGSPFSVDTLRKEVTIPPLVRSSARTALLTIGTLAAIVMVVKVVLFYIIATQDDGPGSPRALADEKTYLQEYYQTYGVRPANRAEADLLTAERRKVEDAQRQAERDRLDAQQAERDFARETREKGQQVAAELQHAEDRAQRAREQEQYDKAREQQEQRWEAQRERERLAMERAKWREILTTPTER